MRHYSLNRLLVLFASAGFVFLCADTIIEHIADFKEEYSVYIPPVFSLIAAAIGFATVARWNESRIRLFHWVLMASVLVAAGGMYYHLTEDDDEEQAAVQQQPTAGRKQEKDKPPLAPLAFAGIAAVGLLGTSRKWTAEVVAPAMDSASQTPESR